MSLSKLREVREDKGFRIWDLAVYCAIALVTAALFIAFALVPDGSPANGINLYYRYDAVFTYDFDRLSYKIVDGAHIEVLSEDEAVVALRFYGDGEEHYNDILIDKAKKSVRVAEANCSARKDCVHMAAITDNGGVIICTPHYMKIEPINYAADPDDPNVGPPLG